MTDKLPDNSSTDRTFQTLRGAITGEETDETPYFAFSATLRIFGNYLKFEEISQHLGVKPTHIHRKGEKKGPRSLPYPHDMWSYKPGTPEECLLDEHITALWNDIKHASVYLRSLKQHVTVDVFLGYRSNSNHAGIEVSHTSLELFTTLEIPFGVSIIIV